MKGLELSERFYWASVDELFFGMGPEVANRYAAGLVGEGSECFGFDDEISQDHDYGPAFCIWLDDELFEQYGADLQRRYVSIASRGFEGFAGRVDNNPAGTLRRVGVLNTGSFYRGLLGVNGLPETIGEWRALPETGLAAAVNGRVFEDKAGVFTGMREKLAAYYPEDIRLRKIASGCMHAAQSGQYNFPRQVSRGENVAAFLALSEFVDSVIHIAYALERRYCPFYKWSHRGLFGIGKLGVELATGLEEVMHAYRGMGTKQVVDCIEGICALIVAELNDRGLSHGTDTFLIPHGVQVNSRITDTAYRRENLMSV